MKELNPIPAADRADATVFGGIFFVAMSVIAFQIVITRVFAISMWHHFTYLVVSLALLGFGASGSLLTARSPTGLSGQRLQKFLAGTALLAGVATALAFLGTTSIEINSLEIWKRPENFLKLLAILLLLSTPFFLSGLAIGGCLTRFPRKVGQLYFTDLAGSALGGLFAPLMLERLGLQSSVMLCGLMAIIGATVFALRLKPLLRYGSFAACALFVYLTIAFSGGAPGVPALTWQIKFAPNKVTIRGFPGGKSETTLTSPVAQVDISAPLQSAMGMGGEFGDLDRQQVRQRIVTQDGTAPTALFEAAADLKKFPSLDDTQAASAYVALKASDPNKQPRTMVIGVGGGIDVMIALYHQAVSVTAVEINSAMIRMVTSDYRDYIGRLFDDPRVQLIHEDGRSFLRRDSGRYDIIQLSGVDTFTALSSGAYTLSESYLYTTQAIKDMYDSLHDGGYINYSRFLITYNSKPRETIRLLNTAYEALQELGVQHPERNILVLQAASWASTMIKKGPFLPEEVAALEKFARAEGFMGLVFNPLHEKGKPFPEGRLLGTHYDFGLNQLRTVIPLPPQAVPAEDRALNELLLKALRADVHGQRDRSDDFLNRALSLSARLGGEVSTHQAQAARNKIGAMGRTALRSFQSTQQDFFTLLRGSPTEREEFIDNYFFNLTPASDDAPFFFNYYRLSKFWEALVGKQKGGWAYEYHPDFPVGHMVLFSSLGQIMVLAFILILLPLRSLARRDQHFTGKRRVFAYFASLGMGFMFIEIGLMQKLILFLGHPVYSMSVVLSGILFFSGLGALLSSRIKQPNPLFMKRLLLAIIVALFVAVLALNYLLNHLLGFSLALRILFALLIIAPLGFALGFPFPLGIRILKEVSPELIPWGWSINGFLSVFSSMAAIVLAMQIGFSGVLILAGVVYIIGFAYGPRWQES